MTSDQVVQISVAVATPILTAALGVLGLMIGEWRQRRSVVGRRKLLFEDAGRQLAFVRDWRAAVQEFSTSPEAAQQALDDAERWIQQTQAQVFESLQGRVREKPDLSLRTVLLIYPMNSRLARLLRGAFYLLLGSVSFTLGLVVASTFDPYVAGTPDYFGSSDFASDLGKIAALMALAVCVAVTARYVEASAPTHRQDAVGPVRNALLLYPLDRWAARVLRAAYLLSVAVTAGFVCSFVVYMFADPKVSAQLFFVVLMLAGWTLGLRFWARNVEARRHRSAAPAGTTESGHEPVRLMA